MIGSPSENCGSDVCRLYIVKLSKSCSAVSHMSAYSSRHEARCRDHQSAELPFDSTHGCLLRRRLRCVLQARQGLRRAYRYSLEAMPPTLVWFAPDIWLVCLLRFCRGNPAEGNGATRVWCHACAERLSVAALGACENAARWSRRSGLRRGEGCSMPGARRISRRGKCCRTEASTRCGTGTIRARLCRRGIRFAAARPQGFAARKRQHRADA
jgi:hypothetical protein